MARLDYDNYNFSGQNGRGTRYDIYFPTAVLFITMFQRRKLTASAMKWQESLTSMVK